MLRQKHFLLKQKTHFPCFSKREREKTQPFDFVFLYAILGNTKGDEQTMIKQEQEHYLIIKDQSIYKSNDLIQRSRFNLSLQEQKIVLYLLAQITPTDANFNTFEFSIMDFCNICGIEPRGKYFEIKEAIKSIADKSIWVKLSNGKETLLRWIEKPYIDFQSGTIKIKLDADMMPYLLQLKSNFTQYELIYTLRFNSKYSIRLYELIKSIHYYDLETYKRQFSLDEIRDRLGAEKYTRWSSLNERVLVPATREINLYSDKKLIINPIKKPHSKSVIGVELVISSKDSLEALKVRFQIEHELGYDISP